MNTATFLFGASVGLAVGVLCGMLLWHALCSQHMHCPAGSRIVVQRLEGGAQDLACVPKGAK